MNSYKHNTILITLKHFSITKQSNPPIKSISPHPKSNQHNNHQKSPHKTSINPKKLTTPAFSASGGLYGNLKRVVFSRPAFWVLVYKCSNQISTMCARVRKH